MFEDKTREDFVTDAWILETEPFTHWDKIFLKKLKAALVNAEESCRGQILERLRNKYEVSFPESIPVGVSNQTFAGFKKSVAGHGLAEDVLKFYYRGILKCAFRGIMNARIDKKKGGHENVVYYIEIVEELKPKLLKKLFLVNKKRIQNRGTALYEAFLPAVSAGVEKDLAKEEWRQRCCGLVQFYNRDYSASIRAFYTAFAISEKMLVLGERTKEEYRKAFGDFILDLQTVYTFFETARAEKSARLEILKEFRELKHQGPRTKFVREIYVKIGKELAARKRYKTARVVLWDGIELASACIGVGIEKEENEKAIRGVNELIGTFGSEEE